MRPRRRGAPVAWNPTNAAYAANRAQRLCDDCGRRSKTARCRVCSDKRKRWPSRQPDYRRVHKKGRIA